MKLNVDTPEPTGATPEPARGSRPGAKLISKNSARSAVSRNRRRGSSASGIRYFVGRPGEPDAKPTLEQEVASEPEALVIAFKSDKRVYFITEYRVTQKIEGGQVRLEKEQAASAAGHANVPKGVSTTNES